MSVIAFGSDELANVASVASCGNIHTFIRFASLLAAYSLGNTAAYNHTYGKRLDRPAMPCTRDEILTAAAEGHTAGGSAFGLPSADRAVSTLQLLRYNLDANDGTDFATRTVLLGLLEVVKGVVQALMLPSTTEPSGPSS